jgi:phosphoribosylpyrophosphate synthetase
MIHLVTRADDEDEGVLSELATEPSVTRFPLRIRRAGNGNVIIEPPPTPEGPGTVVVPLRKGRAAPGEELLEALLCADCVTRGTGHAVIALATYLDYARSDAISADSGALGARAWVRLLETGAFAGVVLPGWHNPALQSLFSLPTASFDALAALAAVAVDHLPPGAWLVAPDLGRAATVGAIAGEHGLRAGFVAKQALAGGARAADGRGWPDDFAGAPVLVIDDEIDSGWTLARAVEWARARGAGPIVVAVTHCFGSQRVLEELRAQAGVRSCLTTRLGDWQRAASAGWEIAEVGQRIADAIGRLARSGVR